MRNDSMSRAVLLVMGAAFGLMTGCYPTEPPGDLRPPALPLVTTDLGMKFVLVRAGEFTMGSPRSERGRELDEVEHSVRITRDFYIGQTEVTRGQFAMFVSDSGYVTEAEKGGDFRTWRNPGITQGDNHPVVCVTWNDARAYCAWLSRKDKRKYRLPTEAEWEYACRAGTNTAFAAGPTIGTNLANYNGTTAYPGGTRGENRASTTPVGSFAPNAWGIYDMVGNVWEWCNDWYGRYPEGSATDPQGPLNGTARISRGGSWLNAPEYCRAAYRYSGKPDEKHTSVGFRCVFER
jgi:formylglycine-generating enzyme required for sulfatase activity